jgi:hypothetical protein
MAEERFDGQLKAGPGGGAFVVLPAAFLNRLGGGARFRVRGRLNGVEFASSTMAMGGGRVCVGVHKATREAAGVSIGDLVVIDIERDRRPRELELPAELVAAFAEHAALRSAFEAMSFTRRREYVESITGAKRAETRARRVARTLDALRERAR